MNPKRVLIYIAVIIIIAVGNAFPQLKSDNYDPLGLSDNLEFEFGMNSGYSDNLLNDYTQTGDRNFTPSMSVWYNPFPSLEVSVKEEFTYYDKTYRLGNNLMRYSLGFVPTNENAPLSVYLTGSLDVRRYHKSTRDFDNNNYDILVGLGWRVADQVNLRMGYGFNADSYIRSSNSSKNKYETFVGANVSFLGSNTLDLELGYSITDYSFVADTIFIIDTVYAMIDGETATVDDYFSDGYLLAFYVSPRYSRSIGTKTGISLEFNYQKFSNEEHSVIIISDFEHISPFAGVTQGRSIELNVKTFLLKGTILTSGVGYWHKTYLRMLDGPFESTRIDIAEKRIDEFSRWYMTLELPISIRRTELFKSFWSLDYTNNVSNFDQFDYNKWTFSTGITYRF